MAVNIKCVSVEWKALGQHGEAYCVTFHVGNDTTPLISQFVFSKKRRKKT